MKIIKHGNPSNIATMNCQGCDCEFEAADWEFNKIPNSKTIVTTCPCCGRTVLGNVLDIQPKSCTLCYRNACKGCKVYKEE